MTLPKHLWESSDHALDTLQSFVDAEIAKKQEKERLKSDQQKTRKLRSKKTIDEELEEDTRVTEPTEEYLMFYFARERQVMQGMYGSDWHSFLKHPNLPREEFETVGSRRSSSNTGTLTTTRRQDILGTMKGKASSISPFLKASKSTSSVDRSE